MATPEPGKSNTSNSSFWPSSPTQLIVELARPRHPEVRRAVLVAEGVAADNDRIRPARDQPRHVRNDDRLAEDAAAKDVADRPIGRFPHLLEVEFRDARFVRRDRRAFDPDALLFDRIGGVDGDLVIGRVAVLDRKVVIEQLDVEIWQDQSLTDPVPDDAGHFVAVELDDRALHLDLRPLRFPAIFRIWPRLRMGRERAQPRRCACGLPPLMHRSMPELDKHDAPLPTTMVKWRFPSVHPEDENSSWGPLPSRCSSTSG